MFIFVLLFTLVFNSPQGPQSGSLVGGNFATADECAAAAAARIPALKQKAATDKDALAIGIVCVPMPVHPAHTQVDPAGPANPNGSI